MTKTFSVTTGLIAAAVLVALMFSTTALAAGITVGNSAINRSTTDTFSDFTIIDTNNPVSANGTLDTFSYYAANTNPFEFVVVDAGNVVQYISPPITPAGTGLQTYTVTGGVPVTAGWNLGVHFDSTGTIPFDGGGALAIYTANGSGPAPAVGNPIVPAGTASRTYSWNASAGLIVDDNLACPGAAYTTIQAAVDAANPGDTVNVCPGIYVEVVNVTTSLTLKSTTLNGAIIKPDNTTPLLDSGVRRAAVYINAVGNVTVDGFEIDGTGGTVNLGIYGFNSDNTTVKNNLVHNMVDDPAKVSGIGIIYYGWGQGIDNALIENNTVSFTDHHGIWIGAVQTDGVTPIVSNNNVIQNNTVHHTWQNTDGLLPAQLWGGAIGMDAANNGIIHGNSIDNTGWNQRDIMLINGASTVSVTDNTLAHSNGAQAATDGWMQPAIEIFPPANNMTITGNSITVNTVASSGAYGWAVWLPDVTGLSSFNNNTITLTGYAGGDGTHGLVLNYNPGVPPYAGLAGNWTIQDNTFQGGNIGSASTAIRLYADNPASSVISISKNLINGWVNGIRSSMADAGNVTANRNSIAGNTTNGFLDDAPSSVTINATCNWWGNASGPSGSGPGSGDAVNGNVNFSTWLTTSDLTDPCNGPLADVTVTIVKYIDGVHATAGNASSAAFPMASCWSATNIGIGCGTYSLALATYDAQTSSMTSGADYSTNEVTTGPSVGASCTDGKPFALVGYSWGDSEVDAATMTATTTSPALVGITTDKHVIVWNKDCTPKLTVTKIVINDNGGVATTSDFALFIDNATTTSGVATTTTVGAHVVSENNLPGYTATIGGDCDVNGNVTLAAGESKNCTITNDDIPPLLKVHILKYLDGTKALASTTSGYLFPMESTWNTANLNAGATTTGNYVLGNNHGGAPDLYGADTSPMQAPANYSTRELTGGVGQPLSPGATCQTGAYRLVGYSTSATSFAAAASSTISTTTPNFFGLTSDRYVIVWNEKCVPPPPPPSPIAACNSQTPPLGFTLLNGSAGHDNVTLAPNTMFVGHGGNDKVNGPNGDYIICLGNGHDKVTLGNGNADIDAGDGNNKVQTGNGNGSIYAGVDNDKIKTGTGNHTINAGEGNNTIDTGDGTQNVTVGSGADKITTGSGADTIAAGEGNNKVKAGGGADTITAGSGNDTVDGGAGIDSCNAGGGINNVTNCP